MGRGSVCDPFDAGAIVERIATGETTVADAYRRYVASAARPFARATFAQKLSRARTSARRFVAAPVETRPPGRPPGRALRAMDWAAPSLSSARTPHCASAAALSTSNTDRARIASTSGSTWTKKNLPPSCSTPTANS